MHCCGLSNLEYEAHHTSIFNPEGYLNEGGHGGGQSMPPVPPGWQGQQGVGLPVAAPPQGPHGQQGLPITQGPLGGGAVAPSGRSHAAGSGDPTRRSPTRAAGSADPTGWSPNRGATTQGSWCGATSGPNWCRSLWSSNAGALQLRGCP